MPADADRERVLGWIDNKHEEAPFLHGYWSWDWADSIARINGTSSDTSSVLWAADGADAPVAKPNARYIGLNLLSELDVPGEYYISERTSKLFYLPSTPLDAWQGQRDEPVLSMSATAVMLDGVSNVTIAGIMVAHARGVGVSAVNSTDVQIRNCTIFAHGTYRAGESLRFRRTNITNRRCVRTHLQVHTAWS